MSNNKECSEEMVSNLKGIDMADNASEGTPEVDRDVRIDEAWKANIKRTYDAYQQECLETTKLVRKQINDVHALTVQAMQNAIETANMVGKNAVVNTDLITKQAIKHSDIATDCTWDPGPGEESLKKD